MAAVLSSKTYKYALADGKRVYRLSDLRTHAGHTVNLTGELKGDTIRVTKIEMPKSSK